MLRLNTFDTDEYGDDEGDVLLDVLKECLENLNDPLNATVTKFVRKNHLNAAHTVKLFWMMGLRFSTVKPRTKGGKEKIREQLKNILKKLTHEDPLFEPSLSKIDRWEWYKHKFLHRRNSNLFGSSRRNKRKKSGKECVGTFFWARLSDFSLITDHSVTIPVSKRPGDVWVLYREFPVNDILEVSEDEKIQLHPDFVYDIVRGGPKEGVVDGAVLFQCIDVNCDGENRTKGVSCSECTSRNPQILKRMSTARDILNDRERSFKILVYSGRGSGDFRSSELLRLAKEKHDFYSTTLHQASFKNVLCLTEKKREGRNNNNVYGFKWKFVTRTNSGARSNKFSSLDSITESERVKKETKRLIDICESLLNFLSSGSRFTSEALENIRRRLNHEISSARIGDLSDVNNFFLYSGALLFSKSQFEISRKYFQTPSYTSRNQVLVEKYLNLRNAKTLQIFNGTGMVSKIADIMKRTTSRKKVVEIMMISLSKYHSQMLFYEKCLNRDRFDVVKRVLESYSMREVEYDPVTKTLVSNTPQKVSMDATPTEHSTVKKLDIGVTNNADVNGVLQFHNSQAWYVNCGEAEHSDWKNVGCLKEDFVDIFSLESTVSLKPEENEVLETLTKSFPVSFQKKVKDVDNFKVTYEPYCVFDMVGGKIVQVDPSNKLMNFKDFRVKYKDFDGEYIIIGNLDDDPKRSFLRVPLAFYSFKVVTGYSKDDSLYEDGIKIRGFEIQDPSSILGLNILRNTGWCYLHVQGSDMNWLSEFLREDSTFKGKLFFPKNPDFVEELSSRICSFWVGCGLMSSDGSGILYKDYQNLTPQVIEEFSSQLEDFVFQVGIPDGITYEEYEDEFHPFFVKELTYVANACSSLRYRGKPLNGDERWELVCSVDFFTVTMERNVDSVNSIRDYGAIVPAVLGVEAAIKPALLDIRGDLQEHVCQKSRSTDSCTSGLIDDFGLNKTKFHLRGDQTDRLFELSTESNYALQQLRNFWITMNPKYHPLNDIDPEESVQWGNRDVHFKNPTSIKFEWCEFREDESIVCDQYQFHIVNLFEYFCESTEKKKKKKLILLGYHNLRLDRRKNGFTIPNSIMAWFNAHQKPIIQPLSDSFWNEEDYTLMMFMGTGKTPTVAFDSHVVLHSHDQGNALVLTTETVKEQTKNSIQWFENKHRLQQASIEVSTSSPGKMMIKRMFRKRWNIIVASHSNLNGILKTIEKSGRPENYYWEHWLCNLLRVYIDEFDEAVAKQTNQKYKSLLRLEKMILKARKNFREKRRNDMERINLSRVLVPEKKCTRVFLSGTGYNCVNDALYNCFELTNPGVDESVFKETKRKMNQVELIFSQETGKIFADQNLLNRLEQLAEEINDLLFTHWKNFYVVGPDMIEKSEDVRRVYVLVKQSDEQSKLYLDVLEKCGVKIKKPKLRDENDDEEEVEGENQNDFSLSDLLPKSVSKRMTLNQKSPKIFDDPNVYIKEIHGEQAHMHEVPLEKIPKLQHLKMYVQVALYVKLKLLVIGRSVEAVQFLEDHVRSWLGIFFRNTPIFVMTGLTPSRLREGMFEAFRNAASPAIFLSSADVIAKSANLPCVSLLYIFSTDFNPAKESQIVCRADRFGRDSPLSIVKVLAKNSIQEDTFYRELLKTWLSKIIAYKSNIKVPCLKRGSLGKSGLTFGLDLSKFPIAKRIEDVDMKSFCTKWVSEVYDHDLLFGKGEKMEVEVEVEEQNKI